MREPISPIHWFVIDSHPTHAQPMISVGIALCAIVGSADAAASRVRRRT